VSSYEDLSVGDSFETPSRAIDDETVRSLVAAGGYTHPLFTDAAYAAASPFGRTPLPGQAVLLIMGGLVEQSGRFDDTVIALTGLDDVRFLTPAFAGDTLHVSVGVAAKEPSGSGARGTLIMGWRCLNERDEPVVEATARMLFRRKG
jgi:acyl dehydratase